MKKQYLLTIVFSIILQSIFLYSPIKASEEIEPYASYNFEGNLMDSKNHSQLTVLGSATNPGNSSTSFGKDDRGPFWQWNSNQSRGGGFYINIDKNIGEEYTIGLKFSFNQTGPGYKKIIDYKNSASDTGFYFYGNQLRFYNYSTNGKSNIGNNQVVNLIIQRSKDKIFRAYIVGDDGVPVLDLDVNDSQDQGVPYFDSVGTKLGFFYDDNVTSAEATNSGKIYMLKIWDKVIDVNNVLDKLENPEDVTVKYEDEDGNKLAEDVILSGKIGDKVIAEEKVFANYELKEVIPNNEVFFTDAPQTITYVYQKQQGADVTVKYEDEDGNKLAEDVILSGKIGDKVIAEEKVFANYELKEVIPNNEVFFTDVPQTITYVYQKQQGADVTVKYEDEDGNKLAEDVILSGKMGDKVIAEEKVFANYELKEVIPDGEVFFTDVPQTITYVYQKQQGADVTVKYEDEDGNKLAEDVILSGKMGDKVIAEEKAFANYELKEVIPNGEIFFTDAPQTITYVYQKQQGADVTVKYEDEDGNKLAEDVILSGKIGDKVIAEEKVFANYELKEIIPNGEIFFTDVPQTITYVYQKQQGADVTVKYEDEDGNKLAEDVILSGKIGDKVIAEEKVFANYGLKEVIPNNEIFFTDAPQTITYVYQKQQGTNVTVKYEDEEGNKLAEDVILSGKMGDKVIAEEKAFANYELKEVIPNSEIFFTDAPQTITYVYKKINISGNDVNMESSKGEYTTPETGDTQFPMLYLMIFVCSSFILAITIRKKNVH